MSSTTSILPDNIETLRPEISAETVSQILGDLNDCCYVRNISGEVHPMEAAALGSSGAYYVHMAAARDKPDFSKLTLDIGDLDIVYARRRLDIPENGASFSGFVKNANERVNWVLNEDGSKGLQAAHPSNEKVPTILRHTPKSIHYVGRTKVEERDFLELDIFNGYEYEHDGRLYTMRFSMSDFQEITDTQGRSMLVLKEEALIAHKITYGREKDLQQAKDLIDLHISKGGSFFHLMETAKRVCPYLSKECAQFILNHLENKGGGMYFKALFEEKHATAFAVTREMLDVFEVDRYPYHNYLRHILPLTIDAYELIKNTTYLDESHHGETMLGVYSHEAGMMEGVPSFGHEKRAADMLRKKGEPVSAVLVEATALSVDKEGDIVSLTPSILDEPKFEKYVSRLEALNIERDEAEKMLYTMFIDVSNIFTRGNFESTIPILIEDYQDTAMSEGTARMKGVEGVREPFTKRKMEMSIRLFSNIKTQIHSHMDKPNFREVFVPMFLMSNKINQLDLYHRYPELSPTDAMLKLLDEIIDEKIYIWADIANRADHNVLLDYLEKMTQVNDPEVIERNREDLNRRLQTQIALAESHRWQAASSRNAISSIVDFK